MHEDYEHAALIGRDVHLRTTGAVSISGELRPPQNGHHVVEVDGVPLLIPERSTHSVSLPHRGLGRAVDGSGHILDDVIDRIDPAHWALAADYSAGAGAVLGEVVGRSVSEVVIGPTPKGHLGSQVTFAGGGIDYQEAAIYLLGQPLAHTHKLAEFGYSRLTQAAVDEITGRHNRNEVKKFLDDGFVVWTAQARIDAEHLLAEPAIQAAIARVAEAIPVHGHLEGEQVRELIGDPTQLTDYTVWLPDYAELEQIREQIRGDQDDETDQA